MTTRVTIEPANHTIEVLLTEDDKTTTQILSPNEAPRDFWIYDGLLLAVREVPTPAA